MQSNAKDTGNGHQLISFLDKIYLITHTLPTKYLQSAIQNKIIELFGEEIHKMIITEKHENEHFGMSANKVTDVSNNTILVVVHQIVTKYLEIKEISIGVCRIKDLKSQTIADELKVSNHISCTITNNLKYYYFKSRT